MRGSIAVMQQRLRRPHRAIVERSLQRIEGQVGRKRSAARQPTIRRENASMTNATYTNPRHEIGL
jgi:hypothetical protein